MTVFLGADPIERAVLDLPGTDLATAVGARVPLDGVDCQLVLRRLVTNGWREIPAQQGALAFAAPAGDASWMVVTFLQQRDGWWSTSGSLGEQVFEESDMA